MISNEYYGDMLFILSDFYKVPVNHPSIVNLSLIQKTYLLYNISRKLQRESEIDFNKLKLTITAINPELAKKMFDQPTEVVLNESFEDELKEAAGENAEEVLGLINMSNEQLEKLDLIQVDEG